MTPDYQTLYVQLGRLLETAPDMREYSATHARETLLWFGRGHALVEAAGLKVDAVAFGQLVSRLRSAAWQSAIHSIFAILYRALAHCELRSTGAAAGSFIPVGNSFDAFAALSKLLQTAKADVVILDPYMDETALTEFGLAVPEGVALRLLADEATHGNARACCQQMGCSIRNNETAGCASCTG